ncbi:MAG: RlmE family RNA methyltransferase [Acidiferrobacteraceae bacterium]
MARSSKRWMREHSGDEFVRRARDEGLRSRAAYKLMEIDQRDHLLVPGMTVIDLGAAPGAWAVYARDRLGPRGRVIALDLLALEAIPGVEVIQGDFTEDAVFQDLLDRLGGQPVDLVLSDMAPNISGIAAVDQARSIGLAELALDLALRTLRPGGKLLVKVFQGEGYPEYLRLLKGRFDRVVTRKPKASRGRSREIYLLALGFQPE